MDNSISNDISKLFVCVFALKEEFIVGGEVEYFCEDVDGMEAVKLLFWCTGALEFISDCDFKLISIGIF